MSDSGTGHTVTVKSGDCLWQIARTNLIAIGTGGPTDADIARETERLAKLNKLDEGGRNRDLIYPGEIIKLT